MHSKILIVAATALELEGLFGGLVPEAGLLQPFLWGNAEADVLVTGPGMVATAFYLGRLSNPQQYRLAINAGIAGSFNPKFKNGTVVKVISDCFVELGAEKEDRFLPLYAMEMAQPFTQGFVGNTCVIDNTNGPDFPCLKNLPAAKGVTVNTISNRAERINRILKTTDADTESMEGAAFFFACRQLGIPCQQIRSISNAVEPGHLDKWDIPLALANLHKTLQQLSHEL